MAGWLNLRYISKVGEVERWSDGISWELMQEQEMNGIPDSALVFPTGRK